MRFVKGQNYCGYLWPVHGSRKKIEFVIQHFVFIFLCEGLSFLSFSISFKWKEFLFLL